MNRLLPLFFFLPLFVQAQLPTTRFEQTQGRETVTYAEGIAFLKNLDARSPQLQLRTGGLTDSGEPLHLAVFSPTREFDFGKLRRQGHRVLLIDNGIHPGEPDGVDASLLLLRDLATGKTTLPANLVLAVVPFYNVDGALNRGPHSRVNQNGPTEYGFRANARNYDLNRDFVKADSRNARSFARLFHDVDPDVFVDTHVSNGADYQHVMTLITTQPDKLGGAMGRFLRDTFEPFLYAEMARAGFPMIPYVTNFGPRLAEEGMEGFVDNPRYSTGYAALFQTFGFMPETHMLKPYPQRVAATRALLDAFIRFTGQYGTEIARLRREARETVKTQTEFPLDWRVDKTRHDWVEFRGYEAGHKPSAVSGLPRLFYDRTKPFTKAIRYFNFFLPEKTAVKPAAYLIPQGWHPVVDLLKLNGVTMHQLPADTTLTVDVTHIDDHKTSPLAYEGHHPNFDVQPSATRQKIRFRKGDWRVPTGQVTDRYLVEMLEPTGPDSFFAWNFFDTILQQKEGYSDYVFEDVAAEFLAQHPDLRRELNEKCASDPVFARSARAQLDFVFRRSPWAEPEYRRLPVFRASE